MLLNKNLYILILKFFFIFLGIYPFCSLHSQTKNKEVSTLQNLISFFQENEGYTINYSDSDIENIELEFETPKTINFELFLEAVNEQTPISVKKTSSKNYIFYINRRPIDFCGVIIDSKTKKPLQNIHVKDIDSETFTDELGKFSIVTRAFNKLKIYGIGYNDEIIKIDNPKQTECLNIEITKKLEQLNEVILISDYLTLGIDKNTDGSIQLSPAKLKLLPGLIEPDIMQSIQLLPGVVSPSDAAADISIRGGNPDENLILWDGIKIYNSGHFFDQISAFNPYVTENIKLIKQGTSAQYGGRISGVIDITSITKVPKKIEGGAGLNLTNYDLNLKIPLSSKFAIILAGRHSGNDLSRDKFNNLEKKVFQNTNLDATNVDHSVITDFKNESVFYDVNAKLIWDLNDGSKIQFSNLYVKNKLDFKSVILNTIKTEDTVGIDNVGSSLEWKKTTKKNLVHKFSTYYTKYDYGFNSDLVFDDQTPITSTQLNQVIDIGGLYHLSIPLSEKSKLLSGYQYTYNDVKYEERNDNLNDVFGIQNFKINNILSTNTVFSEFIHDSKYARLQSGIRVSYFQGMDDLIFEPRLHASFKLSDEIRVDLSGEIKSQVLRQSYQTSNTRLSSIKNAWIISSEETENTVEIPVVKSRQLSAGFSYTKRNLGIIIDSYIKKNDGLVSLNNDTETISDDLYFIGKSTVLGVDILLKKKIGKYRTWFGYSLSQNLLAFPSISDKDFLASNDSTHILNWSHTININRFELGLSWNYRTGLPYSEPTSAAQTTSGEPMLIYENQNDLRLPDYKSFNASLLYSINNKSKRKWNLKLGVSLQNILSTDNIIDRQYTLVPVSSTDEPNLVFDNIEVYRLDELSLPLTPDLLIRLNF